VVLPIALKQNVFFQNVTKCNCLKDCLKKGAEAASLVDESNKDFGRCVCHFNIPKKRNFKAILSDRQEKKLVQFSNITHISGQGEIDPFIVANLIDCELLK